MLPPAWQPGIQLDNGVPVTRAVLETHAPRIGTQFPHGCGFCARRLGSDAVEFCDTVMRTVHSDCHEDECGGCAWLLCTEDRCDHRDECDSCYQTVCKRHGVTCSGC